jgi:DNA-directed RNA polymerase specialized sigma24 family protein
MGAREEWDVFEEFVRAVEPRLRRALIGCRGIDLAQEGVAEALAFAWEHWTEVRTLDNPAGYLFRVGQSRTRRRSQPRLPAPATLRIPDVEPALIPALLALPERQRTAVWLVHACGWTYAEVAEALGVSASAVGAARDHRVHWQRRRRPRREQHLDSRAGGRAATLEFCSSGRPRRLVARSGVAVRLRDHADG